MPLTQTKSAFAALGVAPEYCDRLLHHSIDTPTPIQAAAIPIGLRGQDVIGLAQTGTGKTFAFGLPIAHRLRSGQTALILAPTRELAQQIQASLNMIGLSSVLIIGGDSMGRQIRDLKRRPAVIVATPGRLIDHLQQRSVSLRNVSIAVLDEADRMLDMGFAPAIRTIFNQLPEARQTMLFSATMPKAIAELSKHYLIDPQRIEVVPQGTASHLVSQEVVYLAQDRKQDMLRSLIGKTRGSTLVFARTRHGARKLARMLHQDGHRAAEIHADRTLAQRREALEGFKSGQYRVLVATDIAARGIDVKDIELVINYDVPQTAEDYVHRIGRTGRAGAEGRAVTLALADQVKDMCAIERLMDRRIPVSSLGDPAPIITRPTKTAMLAAIPRRRGGGRR
jgi:ATP-dependent RNA helicase RhlE